VRRLCAFDSTISTTHHHRAVTKRLWPDPPITWNALRDQASTNVLSPYTRGCYRPSAKRDTGYGAGSIGSPTGCLTTPCIPKGHCCRGLGRPSALRSSEDRCYSGASMHSMLAFEVLCIHHCCSTLHVLDSFGTSRRSHPSVHVICILISLLLHLQYVRHPMRRLWVTT
jgi:hypothetical protein